MNCGIAKWMMQCGMIKMRKPCYIVDIDGTVADGTHRLHFIEFGPNRKKKDWPNFFANVKDDLPYPHMRTMLYHLTHDGTPIVYVSGRPESTRDDTEAWLFAHSFPPGAAMYMRPDGDYRTDDITKKELLDKLLVDGWEPIMAFDDRDRVVDMWRANGIPCAQVRRGDF